MCCWQSNTGTCQTVFDFLLHAGKFEAPTDKSFESVRLKVGHCRYSTFGFCILNSYATLWITLEIILRISRGLDFGSDSTWHSTLTKHPSRYSMVAVEVVGILIDYDVASNIYNIKDILKHLLYQGYFQTFTTSRWFWDTYSIKVILRHLQHEGYFETFWNILSKRWISEQELCKSVYNCQRYHSFNHFTWYFLL